MVKIIKLDPEKNPELIKEVNELFGTLSDTINEVFKGPFFDDFKPLFDIRKKEDKTQACSDPKVKPSNNSTKPEPKLSMEWITLGDLIDMYSKMNNNNCDKCKPVVPEKQKEECTKQVQEDEYSNVQNVEHLI